MKIACKYVAIPVMLFMLVFALQASADSLGDKIADQLCYGAETSYTLSTTELAQWAGQEVSGVKAEYKGSDRYIATFYKSSTKQTNATCKMMKSIVSGGETCKQAGVTKSVNVLTRASWGTISCGVGLF